MPGKKGQDKFKAWLAANPPRELPRVPAAVAAAAEAINPYFPAQMPTYQMQTVPTPGQGGRYRGYNDGALLDPVTGLPIGSIANTGDISGQAGTVKELAKDQLVKGGSAEMAALGAAETIANKGNIAGNEAGQLAGTAIGTAFGGPLGGAAGAAIGGALGGELFGSRSTGDPFMGLMQGGMLPAPMGYAKGKKKVKR